MVQEIAEHIWWGGGGGRGWGAQGAACGSSPFRTSLWKGAACLSQADLYVRGKQCGKCGINSEYQQSLEISLGGPLSGLISVTYGLHFSGPSLRSFCSVQVIDPA